MSDVVAVVVIAALASIVGSLLTFIVGHPPGRKQPPRGRSTQAPVRPSTPVATTTEEVASGNPLGPIWLRLRRERRVTLLDVALAGEAA